MGKNKKREKIYKNISVPLHFKEMIDKVRRRQSLVIEDITEFYIVDLLSRFILSKNLFDEEDKEHDDTLALQLYKALQEKSIEEKIAILKRMGDFALYISGFFSEYLGRKLVDIDYYMMMGEGAYGAASELTKKKTKETAVTQIFRELSTKFKRIVDLLAEVSELSSITSDADLVRIYEKWMKTKSPRLKKKLIKEGIIPVFKRLGDETN